MKKLYGYADLYALSLAAQGLSTNGFQADAYAFAGSDAFAETAMERVLFGGKQISELLANIRQARGAQTAEDAFALVLAGKVGSIAKPGQWVVYRDGGKVICEVQTDEA